MINTDGLSGFAKEYEEVMGAFSVSGSIFDISDCLSKFEEGDLIRDDYTSCGGGKR